MQVHARRYISFFAALFLVLTGMATFQAQPAQAASTTWANEAMVQSGQAKYGSTIREFTRLEAHLSTEYWGAKVYVGATKANGQSWQANGGPGTWVQLNVNISGQGYLTPFCKWQDVALPDSPVKQPITCRGQVKF